MYDALLVRHCAPTLVGLKTGSLFSCPFPTDTQMRSCLRGWNRLLCQKGLHILPLHQQGDRTLIYLYRRHLLLRDLLHRQAVPLLREQNYPLPNPERCIGHLMGKLKQCPSFPHEVGLFLGYPPEDVLGFLCDPSACKFSGCWKVYGDVHAARKRFETYHECTRLCCTRLALGVGLEQLVSTSQNLFYRIT